MRPSIFIHINNELNFFKYCLENFKDKCDIIVNFYGKKQETLNFIKQNANEVYEIKIGGKNEIIKSIPLQFPYGVWVCNDDVQVEGEIWKMFEYANSEKNLDLLYPPTDNLYLDSNKIGIHNRHRLSSSAYFLTASGLKKLKLGLPLAYTHTFYGVNIKQVQQIKTISSFLDDSNLIIQEEFNTNFSLRNLIENQLLDLVNSEIQETSTKNIIITLTTENRNFLKNSEESLKEIADYWQADFKIYSDITEVLTPDQINFLSNFKSKRENIINYFAKMMCIHDSLKKYDRVLWIDDTCIISPFCQNLFTVVPQDDFGALIIKDIYGLAEDKNDAIFVKERKDIDIKKNSYINSGVMLVSKTFSELFSFESMVKDLDLFESFYPTQAYLAYKITTDNIPIFDITTINHLMPAMLKYEDKLFMYTDSLKEDIKTIASHGLIHFSGFHKKRKELHKEVCEKFKEIFDQKITLVIMNFSRPENIVNKILPFYSKIPAVDQIIISHCKESSKFDYKSNNKCKIIHRDDVKNNEKYGLFCRYIAAVEDSTNNCTVVVDDDMIVPAHVLAQLYLKWKKHPTKIIGTRGRNIEKIRGKWKYDDARFVRNADIILTHCAMTSIKIFRQLLEQEPHFRDLAMSANVPWNGEDIMLSLFAKFINQDKNIAIHCKYIELDDSQSISSSEDHIEVRDRLTHEIYKYYMKKIYNAIMI